VGHVQNVEGAVSCSHPREHAGVVVAQFAHGGSLYCATKM
jgi:hypothetical protein